MDWKEEQIKPLVKTPPFAVEEVALSYQGREIPTRYYRLRAPSWVNIFALTPENEAILVRQPRVGMMHMTLETPGGGIDDNEDPCLAAHRELEEETGFRAGSMHALGTISPNPAIMTNRLHMFLARDCRIPKDRQHFPDESEQIEIVKVSMAELDQLLGQGQIHNALASLTILMAQKYALKTKVL